MFTGIIEETGLVKELLPIDGGARFMIECSFVSEIELGESIAVNGACLTAVEMKADTVAFDLLEETLRVTNLGDLVPGAKVNLERSLRVGDRLSGHFVQGHVDTVVKILDLSPQGQDYRYEVELPEAYKHLVVHKGSISLNGTSLTVADLNADSLTAWIIPHTYEVTHLHTLKAGDRVNVEYDMLAKHMARFRELA
ncbi:MAG: riboflavin synthase [Verrucomicrobiota bacterium]